MSGRVEFSTRFQRLLALLRYAESHGEDGVTYEQLGRHFGLSTGSLVRELETASMVGADTVNYDEMPFEIRLEEDRVVVRLFSMDQPLRLTPGEALQLVAAADALAAGEPTDSPMRRALAKVADVLGLEPGETIDVDADPYGGPHGRLLDHAIETRRLVRFRYWSYGRDDVAVRTVDPWARFGSGGAWYLVGRDRDASAERRFRLDRMSAVEVLDEPGGARPRSIDQTVTGLPEAAPVVIDLPSHARWVVEHVPVTSVTEGEDGRVVVGLSVTDRTWLERLLLRVGPDARVVSIDPSLGDDDVLAGAARRVLARYRDNRPADPAR